MTQAALIADTIAGMKRALSGTYVASDSDDSVRKHTNRGRKLKRKAQYLHEGQLVGHTTYKRKIDHAGYSRYILSQNPKRYDFYGDELDEEDEDEEADAALLDNNPYGEVKLEHLLVPLSAVSELPTHPSLSTTYKSSVVTEMAQQACEMVHKERKTLWAIKQLAIKFRGDENWVPCETLHTDDDHTLFAIDPFMRGPTISSTGCNIHRDEQQLVPELLEGTVLGQALSEDTAKASEGVKLKPNGRHPILGLGAVTTLPMQDIDGLSLTTDGLQSDKADITSENPLSTSVEKSLEQSAGESTEVLISGRGANLTEQQASGISKNFYSIPQPDNFTGPLPVNLLPDRRIDVTKLADEERQADEIQAPAHRMTTRAQANAASEKTTSTHTRSSSPSDVIASCIHPLYVISPTALPERDFGLLPTEAEDIRCVITMWLQKQEEVCRGAERLYEGLLKADRMRKTVFRWCKAEAHTSEMSDGEDWYDKEEWGLDEELKKGQLEEDDDAGNQGKKTRGRRAQ